jgi:putative ABC transport system substrate-binding protein
VDPADWEQGLLAIPKRPGTALTVLEDPGVVANSSRIAALLLKHRLPAVFPFREHVEDAGLVSYGVNLATLFRRAARYVDKILRGAKPADLPVEQPTTFELLINLKTAKALGLTIPQSLLLRADQVIP